MAVQFRPGAPPKEPPDDHKAVYPLPLSWVIGPGHFRPRSLDRLAFHLNENLSRPRRKGFAMSNISNRENVMLPMLACDRILFAALWAVWRDPELLKDLGTLFLREESPSNARALFNYLFVDTDCPALGTNNGIGFRLRDPIDH